MGVNSNMSQKKIIATTDNSKWKTPKKRKPMTEEQKKAAGERLAKAREARAAKNPDYGKTGVHTSVKHLEDEHQLHPDKVKNWIKTQKDLAKVQRISVRQNIKGAAAKLADHEGYVRNMQSYLRTGHWIDDFGVKMLGGKNIPPFGMHALASACVQLCGQTRPSCLWVT